MLYDLVLTLHTWVRWIILGLGAVVAARAFGAAQNDRPWEKPDNAFHAAFVGVVDLQFLLGLLLYAFLSPVARLVFVDPGHAMKIASLRFFGVEHVFGMLIAIAIVHVGRAKSKRDAGAARHRRVWKTTAGALLVFLVSIPWPFLPYGRPLARLGGDATTAAPLPAVCPPAYRARCAVCHGAGGHGDGPAGMSLRPQARDFTAPGAISRADADLATVIREGGTSRGLSAAMPAHGDLSNAEVEALVACVHAFAGK